MNAEKIVDFMILGSYFIFVRTFSNIVTNNSKKNCFRIFSEKLKLNKFLNIKFDCID